MAVSLSVAEVRHAIYRETGTDSGAGVPSTRLLGRWFHDVFGALIVGTEDRPSPLELLGDLERPTREDCRTILEQAAYQRVLGPRLTRARAALQDQGAKITALWQATREACGWLAELYDIARQRQSRAHHFTSDNIASLFSIEEALQCELHDPSWSDSVRLVGIADAILRIPGTTAWCVVEFKLGQTSPEADLAQAALYHMMLERNADEDASGMLALFRFRPQRSEQLLAPAHLVEAKSRLLDLIGTLAGVKGDRPSKPLSKPTTLPEESRELGERLIEAWREYQVDVAIEEPVIVGPTFIRFPLRLGRGTVLRSVERYTAELQARLKLRAKPVVRMEQGQLCVDVERGDRATVHFADIRDQLPQGDPLTGGSHVPIGVDLNGRLICGDLANTANCHMLTVGTTGSGKSEWLRVAIAGLLTTNTPETLRLVIIDPKRNAFHALKDSPYLWRKIVYPGDEPASQVLESLVDEMERRYRLAPEADNFQQIVLKSGQSLPRIVCICDEFRDLLVGDKNESKAVLQQISRLGAKARAAGIHLLLATQEASRQTIPGTIDANIPARIGLKMSKDIESRMLINETGAEDLLGNGDLLFKDIGSPRRLQSPLLSEQDRQSLFR